LNEEGPPPKRQPPCRGIDLLDPFVRGMIGGLRCQGVDPASIKPIQEKMTMIKEFRAAGLMQQAQKNA